MRAPAFWWRPSGKVSALRPLSAVTGFFAARRFAGKGTPLPLPVLCLGNFVVGGAGKTPCALTLARLAAHIGLQCVFLTRGYGGRLKGPIQVDPLSHTAYDVGDEALLLAAHAPTIMTKHRPSAHRLLAGIQADLIIMDDGFQNPSVRKDFSILVLDAAVGVGNGLVLPFGPLRAPLPIQLGHTDLLCLVGEGTAGDRVADSARQMGKPVARARLLIEDLAIYRDKPILAYAGIGRPEKFFTALRAGGLDLRAAVPFSDHHIFTETEARRLIAAADKAHALLLTTEKDAIRLKGCSGAREALAERSISVSTSFHFDDEAVILGILRKLTRNTSQTPMG